MGDWTGRLSAGEQEAFRKWTVHQEKVVLPAMEESGAVVSVAPSGKPDAKFCVELGMALMLGKPVILVVDKRAAPVPPRLRQVADVIVEVDLASTDPAVIEADSQKMRAAMDSVLKE